MAKAFCASSKSRCQPQDILIFDEPESALSPSRQIEFLK
jgi:predicted ATPase